MIAKILFASMAYACGALGGTRTPTMLLTATSRQRVYQFRHERDRFGRPPKSGRINGADVTNRPWGYKTRAHLNSGDLRPLFRLAQRLPGDFGSICLTSTAMRLRSTSTTPEAIGRLLASTLTSSASVASNSMMAPRESRKT